MVVIAGVTITGGVLAFYLAVTYKEEIKNGIKSVYGSVYNSIFAHIVIDIKLNPKCLYAIKKEIMKTKKNGYNVTDGVKKPNYCLANGRYVITYLNKWIIISITDAKVKMSVWWRNMDFLINFMDHIYEKHTSSDKVILFYNLNKGKWNFPVFRRPRKLTNIRQTSDMTTVLDNIGQFLKNEDEYEKNGMPYRKGYLLEGATGVGKSTIIEILAMKYNKSAYLVNLNALNMTDALLINLISTIPPYSIIVIEEIEKQLETLKKNRNNMVSEGGILTALDGPQRLSHGCIVIMTSNNINSLDDKLKIPLLRPGRIDKHYVLRKDNL